MHVVPYMGYTHPTDILITEIQFNQHRFHTLGIMLTKISSTDSTHWESCSPKYSAPIQHTGNHAHQNIQHRFHTLGIMLTRICMQMNATYDMLTTSPIRCITSSHYHHQFITNKHA